MKVRVTWCKIILLDLRNMSLFLLLLVHCCWRHANDHKLYHWKWL